ncbi:S1 RNA-binding domain-containing protein, partial [Dehalococcoidia bacterium]|nr:S1 RNA-binding domain-containing protein [Dehalococcoidia bacterium]
MKSDFLLAIAQLAAERNLPKDLVFKAVEAALLSTYKKDDSTKRYNLSVGILPASGEIKVFSRKTVVESPTNTWREIALSDAREIRKDVEIGETIDVEIHPPDAGRIGVQTAKQVVMQRLREAEHEFICGTFAHREGDILSGVIQRIDARQIIVDLGKAEGLLPMAEQVRAEHYRVGQRLMVFLVEVSQTNKGPRLLLSRTHPGLVRRLFEFEVPEISNGIVEVKSVAREPGSRTK